MMQARSSSRGLQLEFVPNPAGEEEGLSHAGIETYRDEPYAGAAREIGQNSRDAAASLPVRISFDVLDIPRADIPGIDTLQSIIESCFAQVDGKEKETAFFQQASIVVAAGSLKVLRIADFNTTGATGPSRAGTPFHSLVKASGVSVKGDVASGGSFGIGKNAVFAVSDLQTVFYSTVYLEHGEKRFLSQGKVILVSHQAADGTARRQVGYWGHPDFVAVEDPADVPEWLRREDVGTSVFVLGFRETPNWQSRITYPLIQNFFPAVHYGEMEFVLDHGKFEIGKMGLAALFEDPKVRAVAKDAEREHEFDLSRNLYECLVSPEAKEANLTLPVLGRVQIRILVAEGLPKKVFVIRNGMLITDSLVHFGDKFVRFPMYRDFVAIVIPMDREGSAFIKRLEDPKHHELSPERLPNAAKRLEAKVVMKRLAYETREAIKEHTLSKFDGEISADEMTRFFADSDASRDNKKSDAVDPQTIRYTVEPRRERKMPRGFATGSDHVGAGIGGADGGRGPDGDRGNTKHPNPNPPNRTVGGGGPKSVHIVPLRDVRNILPTPSEPKRRTIYFTATEGGQADITIQAVGLNDNEDLSVALASGSSVSGAHIKRNIVANQRTRIDVEFEEDYQGPIDVRVSMESGASEVNQ